MFKINLDIDMGDIIKNVEIDVNLNDVSFIIYRKG